MCDYQFLFSGFPRLAVVEVCQDNKTQSSATYIGSTYDKAYVRGCIHQIYPNMIFVVFYMVQYFQFKYLKWPLMLYVNLHT